MELERKGQNVSLMNAEGNGSKINSEQEPQPVRDPIAESDYKTLDANEAVARSLTRSTKSSPSTRSRRPRRWANGRTRGRRTG